MFEFSILIFIPLLSAVVCYFITNIRLQFSVTLFVSALHLIFSLMIFIGWYQPELPFYFSTDSLSKLFLPVLSNVYFWVVLVSFSYLKKQTTANSEEGKKYYFLLLNFYLFANTAAILSNHFGMYWVAVEGTTLSVAPLIYYYRNEEALEAMWKYLFLVSIGIAFAFIGILFLTLSANGTLLEGKQLFFPEFVKHASELNPVWLKASFIFIFVGLSTKIGIAPMHSADVDATSNSPSPIAALMSGSLRVTALLGVMRIFQIVQPTSTYQFAKTILIIGGLLSLFVAFVFMFKVNNYKRMLAYSSIAHAGYLVLGVVAGGDPGMVSKYMGYQAILFYLAAYTFMNLGAFAFVIYAGADGDLSLDRCKGLGFRHPIPAAAMAIFMLSLAGIPPTMGFLAKIYLFQSVVAAGDTGLAVIAVLNSVVAVYYYLRVVVMMYMHESPEEKTVTDKSRGLLLAVCGCALVTLLLGIFPAAVIKIVQMCS